LTTFTQTVTISNASPAVFTTPTAHGFSVGQTLYFTTTGSLPTGLTANESYYITAVPSTTTFNVSATPAGSNVNTSSAGSGTHTLHYNPIPSGSINAPDGSINTFSTTNGGRLLAGSYSLLTAASGAMTAGQGFITNAFYIDTEDQAKLLTVKFYYNLFSGGLYQPGNSSNTFAIYIYDVTNSAWIQPAGVYGMTTSVSSGLNTPAYSTATFQTTSNSTQYQLAIVAINQWQGGFSASWDDFTVGPQTAPLGVPATDWVNAGTTIISATTTAPVKGTTTTDNMFWKRDGGDMIVRMEYVQTAAGSGTTGTGDFLFQIPTGYQIDTTKVTPYNTVIGTQAIYKATNNVGSGNFSSTVPGPCTVCVYDSTHVRMFYQNQNTGFTGGSVGAIGSGNSPLNTTSQTFAMEFRVPIVGWSSNVQMSSDTDTRVVSMIANTSTTAGSASVNYVYTNVIQDSHGAYSNTTGKYTVPVSGVYQISAGINSASPITADLGIRKNGTVIFYGGEIGALTNMAVSGLWTFTAGDVIDVVPTSAVTANTTANVCYFMVNRLSGPSVVAASEAVYAQYYVSAASFTSSPTIPVNYDTKVLDSHNAVTTSATAWKFTAPVSGVYEVTGNFWTAVQLLLYKNGTSYQTLSYDQGAYVVPGSAFVRLNAGDYIDVRNSSSSAVSGGSQTSAISAVFQVKRISS
jgi:hypothetical protein